MLAQIRLYTVNRGQMDEFLKNFEEVVLPLHEKVGLPVTATYVNRPQNEFIWVRSFTDEQDRDAKLKAFQEARDNLGKPLGEHVAKMEVRDVESAFVPMAARA